MRKSHAKQAEPATHAMTTHRRTPLLTALALVLGLMMSKAALAQCPPAGWLPGDGAPGLNGWAFATAVLDPDGPGPRSPVIVVGGQFTTAGNIDANRIAIYDPTVQTWSALGSGTSFPVTALAPLSNGDLIVGGGFSTAGGLAVDGVARWNGTTWSQLGSGLGIPDGAFRAYAFAVLPNGDLIAGGRFATAGGLAANCVARWDGVSWSALGQGVDGIVRTLAVLRDGSLVAGGEFTHAGGIATKGIARWNGTSWSTLGSGLDGGSSFAYGMAVVPNGDLVVGGSFTVAGGVGASNLALWNGTSWERFGTFSFGSGANGVVQAVTVLPNGDVVIGGQFSRVGTSGTTGTAAQNIARWDGSAWSAMGAGVGVSLQAVNALAASNTTGLVAAGRFTSANSQPASNFARYSFGGTAPALTQQPNSLTTCGNNTASFSIAATGTAPLSYQWRKSGTPIDAAANPSAATPTLSLAHVSGSSAGLYDCVITNACGSITSNAATLTVCVADVDDGTATGTCDGGVTIDDLLFYITLYADGVARADLDDGSNTGTHDGGVTIDDLLYYLQRFEAGC